MEGCRDLFYKMCDKFNVEASNSCNVVTFGNAAVKWFSQDISAKVWSYAEQYALNPSTVPEDSAEEASEEGDSDWSDWNWRLMQS